MFWMTRPEGILFSLCLTVLCVWIIIIAFLAFKIYQNTVLGLDRGDFLTAKNWTLYGAIIGFIFGGFNWIILIIFLISYVSFDDALFPKPYYYAPPGYYPYQPPYSYGPPYPPQQPTGINPCPRCGQPLRYVNKYQKWYCNNCKVYIKS